MSWTPDLGVVKSSDQRTKPNSAAATRYRLRYPQFALVEIRFRRAGGDGECRTSPEKLAEVFDPVRRQDPA